MFLAGSALVANSGWCGEWSFGGCPDSALPSEADEPEDGLLDPESGSLYGGVLPLAYHRGDDAALEMMELRTTDETGRVRASGRTARLSMIRRMTVSG